MFQTKRLKVAKEMVEAKTQVHINEEPCDKILERKTIYYDNNFKDSLQ